MWYSNSNSEFIRAPYIIESDMEIIIVLFKFHIYTTTLRYIYWSLLLSIMRELGIGIILRTTTNMIKCDYCDYIVDECNVDMEVIEHKFACHIWRLTSPDVISLLDLNFIVRARVRIIFTDNMLVMKLFLKQ